MDDISITGLSPLDVLDISELTTELLTAQQATLTNAAVLKDLTVAGNIIVTGDQVFQGNQEVQKALKVDGSLTAGTVSTKADATFENNTTAKQGLIVGGGRINLKGETAPEFVSVLSPSGMTTVNGSWYLWLGNLTGYISGYDQCQVTVTTTGGSAVPSVIPTSIEVEVGGVIMVTQTVNLLREGTVSIVLPISIFWNPLQDPFVYFATSSTGANWSTISFKFEVLPPTYLLIERDPSTNITSYASPYPQRFQVGGSTVATLSAQSLQVNGSVNASSFAGNGSQINSINAANISSGLLPISRGGTSSSAFTSNKIIVFSGTSNSLISPSNLHWDNTNARLGIGNSAPNSTLDVGGFIQATRLGLGHTTTAPTFRLEVRSNQTTDAGGIIADFQTSAGTSRLQIVEQTTADSIPASIKNVGSTSGIGMWATAGPLRFMTGTSGTTRAQINQDGTINLGGNTTISGTLTVGTATINSNWVRSQLAAGTGIGYDSSTGTVSNTAPTQWQNVLGGILYTGGQVEITGTLEVDGELKLRNRTISNAWLENTNAFGSAGTWTEEYVGIGTSTLTYPFQVATSQEGGFNNIISAQFQNEWAGNLNSNIFTKYRTALIDWDIGISEDRGFYFERSGGANISMILDPSGNTCIQNKLTIGALTTNSSNVPLWVRFADATASSKAAVFQNITSGGSCFAELTNTNTVPIAQNSLVFGVSNTGTIQFTDKNATRFIEYSTAAGRLILTASEIWKGLGNLANSVLGSRTRFNYYGTASTAGTGGCHQAFYTTTDNYPSFYHLNLNHDNTALLFDAYYDGSFRSAHSGSNFAIYKLNNQLLFMADASKAQGATTAFKTAITINSNANVTIPTLTATVIGVGTSILAGDSIGAQNFECGTCVTAGFFGVTSIAGYASRAIFSAPTSTNWIAAFNDNQTGTGSRGVIFTRNGTIIGAIRYDAGAVAYLTTSDYRLKENVREFGCGLSIIRRLRPVKFTWKEDKSEAEGFIAHELKEVIPSAVFGERDQVNEDGSIDPQSIDKSFIITPLVAACKQLADKADAQEVEIERLKAEVEQLKQRNQQLEEAIKTLNGFDVLALTKQVAAMSEALKRKYIL